LRLVVGRVVLALVIAAVLTLVIDRRMVAPSGGMLGGFRSAVGVGGQEGVVGVDGQEG
jgi:hypothetical protein